MARQGLMDDCGYHGFDYEPDCSKCRHENVIEQNGQLGLECSIGVCEFEEKIAQ